jgi:hypothetical protein
MAFLESGSPPGAGGGDAKLERLKHGPEIGFSATNYEFGCEAAVT